MGKKKMTKKTKELSVAIAESSSIGAEESNQQPQQITPRKRGRPRKIVEKTESEEIKGGGEEEEEEEAGKGGESESKRAKTRLGAEEEEQEKMTEVPTSSSAGDASKKEVVGQSKETAPRSRARRKGKPRKSSC